ncbi:MAG TPA: O-antigen ligase family protein [Reyranella sp.]|nr:O-antigen ligase family protein [Reyranella sp.]
MSGRTRRSRRSGRHQRRLRYEAEAEAAEDLGRIDWPRLALMIVGWLAIAVFLLLLVVAPLALGANRDWAWAPILVALGVLGVLVALGVGDIRGFAVEPDERWPLLALVACFLAFTFVGLLQLSTLSPAAGSAPFYARAQALLGQAHAVVPTLAVDQTRDALLRCLACVLVFVIARALFRTPARARLLLYGLLVSATLVVIYGLAQQVSTGGCYVGSLLKKQGDYTGDRCLMSGTFANSNSFGCFVGMAFAAAVALVLQERRRQRSLEGDDEAAGARLLRRLSGATPILVALALLFLGTQLFSSSRAAFAATVVVTGLLLYLSMRGRWKSRAQVRRTVIAAALVGVLMLGLAGGAMLRKISLLGDSGQFDRTAIWATSLAAAAGSPWLGWGLGAYQDIYASYQPDQIRLSNDKAHSTPIELIVESGVLGAVPGLLMVLIPWAVCLLGAWRRRRHRTLMVAAVAVPAIAMLHSTVDFSLQIPAIAFVVAAFLGMGWAQTFYRTPVQEPAFTEPEE